MAFNLGNFVGSIGKTLRLPELGISEALGGSNPSAMKNDVTNRDANGNYTLNGTVYNRNGDPIMSLANQNSYGTTDTAAGSGGGGYNAAAAARAAATADEQRFYDENINELNRILGNIGVGRDQGLQRLNSSFNTANTRLGEDRTRAMEGYNQQDLQNATAKLRGTEQVDQYAGSSYNSLQNILRGANAGNSSVARELIPQLVSKAAGQRRQGVFNTYGENQQGIDVARQDATTQFDRSAYDLGEQRKRSEEDFLRSILESEQDIYSQIRQAQEAKAQAAGRGYAGAMAASAGTRGQIANRDAQLNSLFNNYQPALAPTAVNLKTPELGQYTVDKAAIQGGGNTPAESAYYLPQLRKKQELW